VATNLSPNFIVKAGFDYFGFKLPFEVETGMTGYLSANPTQEVDNLTVSFGKPKIQLPHGKVLVDWYPAENGIFSLSAGVYVGNYELVVAGEVEGYQQAVLENGGQISFHTLGANLSPRPDGTFDGKIRIGNKLKPYVGIGFGRTIATNNHIGFKFDLGVTYQGSLKFISEQANIDDVVGTVQEQPIPDEVKLISQIAQFWPVLNFSLSYRF
jgi:hypothetical protein